MTQNPCRCETCEYFPAGSIFDYRCPYTKYTLRHAGNHPQCIKDPWLASATWQIPIDVMSELTSDIGCLSHPKAREYLMKDVVAELCKWGVTCEDNQDYESVNLIGDVIALIREGVRK